VSKIIKFTGLFVVLVVVLALFAGSSLAQPPGPPYRYTTYIATCEKFPPEEMWFTGKVLHMKGMVSKGVTFGDPYFSGVFEQRTDVILNTESGSGNAAGSIIVKPEAYAGTWEGGHFQGPIHSFMYEGQGIDYGTGELAGLQDVVQIHEILPDELPAEWFNPCGGEPVLSASVARGMIVRK
jgi:hypothetical protein